MIIKLQSAVDLRVNWLANKQTTVCFHINLSSRYCIFQRSAQDAKNSNKSVLYLVLYPFSNIQVTLIVIYP